MNRINEVTFRYLHNKERNIPTAETTIPLVIEPKTANVKKNIKEFLQDNSEQIREEITKHGAVLLRGFDINSEKDFEQAVLSIRHIRGMNSYFMSEPGRTLIEGTNYVFYTNKFIKTGGTLDFGGFHNENYYSPDVPKYICFCCLKKPTLGGETGLVDTTKVYEDLDESIKHKLESHCFHVRSWPCSHLANRYALPVNKVIETCAHYGLQPETEGTGETVVSFYKPLLLKHPDNGKVSFNTNFTTEIPYLHSFLSDLLRPYYKGWKWAYHKLAWHSKVFRKIVQLKWRQVPKRLMTVLITKLQRHRNTSSSVSEAHKPINHSTIDHERVANAFTMEETKKLAEIMQRHTATFVWQKGDILIVDNLQVAHGGMPGLGKRVIRALLCNPIKLNFSSNANGCQMAVEDTAHQPLSEIFESSKMVMDN